MGIPNVVGDDSSLGVNVSVQQQTNKSWTYGTSDSKTVTKRELDKSRFNQVKL